MSIENEPLGTGGPLKLVEQQLRTSTSGYFYCLNADVVCDFPLKDARDTFVAKKQQHPEVLGQLMVTKVEEPSAFGVILSDDAKFITKFVEKPKE